MPLISEFRSSSWRSNRLRLVIVVVYYCICAVYSVCPRWRVIFLSIYYASYFLSTCVMTRSVSRARICFQPHIYKLPGDFRLRSESSKCGSLRRLGHGRRRPVRTVNSKQGVLIFRLRKYVRALEAKWKRLL